VINGGPAEAGDERRRRVARLMAAGRYFAAVRSATGASREPTNAMAAKILDFCTDV
jgi:uncharacterized protein YerC